MAIANIPDVTSIPFVTTIPRFVVNPRDQPAGARSGGKPVPLIGPDGPLRRVTSCCSPPAPSSAPAASRLAARSAPAQPLPDNVVLSAAEAADDQGAGRRLQHHHPRRRQRAGRGLRRRQRRAHPGSPPPASASAASRYTSAFLTGGIFSYDGVHPTPFGYAYSPTCSSTRSTPQYDGDIPLVEPLSVRLRWLDRGEHRCRRSDAESTCRSSTP